MLVFWPEMWQSPCFLSCSWLCTFAIFLLFSFVLYSRFQVQTTSRICARLFSRTCLATRKFLVCMKKNLVFCTTSASCVQAPKSLPRIYTQLSQSPVANVRVPIPCSLHYFSHTFARFMHSRVHTTILVVSTPFSCWRECR